MTAVSTLKKGEEGKIKTPTQQGETTFPSAENPCFPYVDSFYFKIKRNYKPGQESDPLMVHIILTVHRDVIVISKSITLATLDEGGIFISQISHALVLLMFCIKTSEPCSFSVI